MRTRTKNLNLSHIGSLEPLDDRLNCASHYRRQSANAEAISAGRRGEEYLPFRPRARAGDSPTEHQINRVSNSNTTGY